MFQIPNDLRLAVIEAFRREGIEIPYPRQVGLTPEQIPAPDMVTGREHGAPVGRA
jgi:small-conductance mechanosensitive channel